ncbi:MAG: NAD(P)/FAD-dependent oxidoreductase, partial [Chitinophagales bacterium]
DFVIIGSGLGGLLCANILLKEGYSVCVLEKNRQFGGALQIFVRDKAIHDTGVHYIGGLAPGQNLYQFFSYLGLMEELKLKRLSLEAFDKISFSGDDKIYNIPQGYERFSQQLQAYFPKEKSAIEEYCEKLQEISANTAVYNLKPFEPGAISPYQSIGLYDYLESITDNEKLRNVLMGNNLLYAARKEKTSLYEHALILNSYISSAWKCVDGGAQIARALVKKAKAMGGTVRNYAEVENMEVDAEKQISAVQLKNGEKVLAKKFISNVHPAQTLKMIGAAHFRKSYFQRMTAMENSTSVFSVFLNLKEKSFPYLNHNCYHFRQADFWEAGKYKSKEWPKSMAIFTPANSKDPEFAESMNIMCYMDFEEVSKWKNTYYTIPHNQQERGADYRAFKRQKEEQVIDALEERFPEIRSCIKSVYSASPLSYRDYLATPEGSMYGMLKDYQHNMATYVSHNTKLGNLFFTGQNINLHGILGVTISAFVTCSEFVDMEKLMREVRQ